MKILGLISLLLGFSTVVFADDDPNSAITTQNYDAQACIDNATNECINTVCENSSDINCSQNCSAKAAAECENSQGNN